MEKFVRDDVLTLAETYRAALTANGATPAGVLWPRAADLATRFEVLVSPIEWDRFHADQRCRVLDLGCGPGLLLDYLAENDLLARVDYYGIDILEQTLDLARARWPDFHFESRDVRDRPFAAESFDYCIICGVFTGRFALAYREMEAMVRGTLKAVWPSVTTALGFNVMSKHVDWERDDLFHWPLDELMAFCKAELSRHVALRLDYGLWEASAFIRRAPVTPRGRIPGRWLSAG